ncbi:hypothetical protein AL515_12100 [Citrobacter sp. FDAARGOS_156]|nr:hypothetical protein [Citrobacter sp. FDAARGOS_156]AMH14553.2 hypothetical protein AL515_12100 [Citrobacter sp. FDAARGOS_156]
MMNDLNRFYFDLPQWLGKSEGIHRQFIGNFISCLHDEQLQVVLNPVSFPCYGLKRLAIKDSITFSFHSYNNDKNVFSIKESPIYGLYSVDKNGYSGWADICVNFSSYIDKINKIDHDSAKSIIGEKREFFRETKLSKHQQPHNHVALPSNYLFFPMQVNSDSVTDHENISAMEALDYVAALAKKTNRKLVIKRHPMCKSRGVDAKIAYLLATNENVLSVDANIHELIEGSSAVIACNSGTSIEALIFGKPVYCFGRSEWYEATHKIEALEDFDAIFLNDTHSTMSVFQEKLIAYLLSEYWIQFDDIESIKEKIKYCISLYESNYGDDFIDNHNNGECYVRSFLNAQREIAILKRKQKKYKKDYELLSFVIRFVLFLPFKATLTMLRRNKNH